MGRFCFNIDDTLEAEFRQEISKRLGMKKGNIQVAVEAAIRDWIKRREIQQEHLDTRSDL